MSAKAVPTPRETVGSEHSTYLDFLAAFYPDHKLPICFRAFKPKSAPECGENHARKLRFSLRELTSGLGEQSLRGLNKTRGIYFLPNGGGDTNADIRDYNAVFIERDDISIEEQHDLLNNSPICPSIRVETKRSVHAYWLLEPGTNLNDWTEAQFSLINYFNADPANKNPARLMRLPGFDHITYKEGVLETKLVEVVQLDAQKRYSIREVFRAFPKPPDLVAPSRTNIQQDSAQIIEKGKRNPTLFSIAGSLRRAGLAELEIFGTLEMINKNRVQPPLGKEELEKIAGGVMRYSCPPKTDQAHVTRNSGSDGPRLAEAALIGPAGAIVTTIAPHTEADVPALLVQLLSGFGCIIGRSAHFVAEADQHFTKLNAVLVGESSKGRKGTSWGHIRRLLFRVDKTFSRRVVDGLASGEGLIQQVSDLRLKQNIALQDDLEEKSMTEKRLFVLEPEFARVLRVMQREGNTLSPLIRQAWDSDCLRVMTKSPLEATGIQITIVGHITIAELRRNLGDTDMLNGFANRFLWVCTKRSKELPFGGNLAESDLDPYVAKLRGALEFAQGVGELKRSTAADTLWATVYGRISRGSPDLVGAVTSRAEAQVMRIALIYAVLDSSRIIEKRHLEAALSLWQYTEDSARYIFGSRVGEKVSDRILSALIANPDGITGSGIQSLFHRNISANRISSSLDTLLEAGLIRTQQISTRGRDAHLYTAACQQAH